MEIRSDVKGVVNDFLPLFFFFERFSCEGLFSGAVHRISRRGPWSCVVHLSDLCFSQFAQEGRVGVAAKMVPLTVEKILIWADAHHRATGSWPTASSGRVCATAGDRWRAIDEALRYGRRGLPGGSSLGLLLAEHRGLPPPTNRQPLTIEQILRWADAHCARTGQWPTEDSGPIPEAPQENWRKLNAALRLGARSLPAGRSLGRLLSSERGVRNRTSLPPLTVEQILCWADAHRERTGQWPGRTSGPVAESPAENWAALGLALRNGYRGLPRGTTLRNLLSARKAVAVHDWEEEAIRRYRAGEALNRLARSLGVSVATVRQALRQRGILRRGSR